jgi:hypothetical protein
MFKRLVALLFIQLSFAPPSKIHMPNLVPKTRWQRKMMEAVDLLETSGWVKGSLHSVGEGFCVVGAMDHVCYGFFDCFTWFKMTRELGKTVSPEWMKKHGGYIHPFSARDAVVMWNDNPITRKEEVLSTMRTLALR